MDFAFTKVQFQFCYGSFRSKSFPESSLSFSALGLMHWGDLDTNPGNGEAREASQDG
jgi:hypothetical protein